MKFVLIDGKRLEFVRLCSSHPRDGAPSIVFLHEGLGSLSMWRDFPQRVADATGCEAVVYSRYGYGRSERLQEKRPVSYMHDEALRALPEFLDTLGLVEPVLLGHSDGGSIALIHAGGTARKLAGLILMAPHIVVEDLSVESIARAGDVYRSSDLRLRLGRYHEHVDDTFRGWNDIWLDPAFRSWNITGYLPRISCPILAMQGEDDEYGTLIQIEEIARQVANPADVDLVKLADCRHSPHRDQPDAVVERIAEFIDRIVDSGGRCGADNPLW